VDETALETADDPTLVAALVAGDPRAPGILWRRFAPMVFRMLRRTLGRNEEVEDIAQEVFLCVFRKASGLRNPKALKAFFIGTTTILARCEIRRVSSRRRLGALTETLTTDAEALTGRSDAREALLRFYRILNRLKPRERSAFVLRFVDGVPLNDVAVALDVSLATAKRRLARSWARVVSCVERDPLLSHYRCADAVVGRATGGKDPVDGSVSYEKMPEGGPVY
jgi:RNA polymerase sigma-70 factor (ECF subfamily)